MDILLDELVQEVLCRLSIKSLLQCRLVCRKLRDLTHDPYFTRIHTARSLAAKPGIMVDNFVYNHQNSSFYSYYYFINRRNYTPTHLVFPVRLLVPDVSEFCVAGSRNGLLCFIRHAPSLTSFVCNPFFRKFIMLPLHDHPHPRYAELLYRAVDFGFCPKTQSYKVLHMSQWRSILEPDFELPLEIYVYKLGEESWNCIDGHGKMNVILRESGLACNVNGALHWVDGLSAAFLTVFDLEHDVFDEMPGPVTDTGRFSTGVIGNCLSIMNTRDNILEVWIMREYWVAWEKCFVINLDQLFDVTKWCRVLDFRMEERELLILNKERVLMYNSEEGSLIEVANFSGQNWWYIVLHSDTLVELD